MEESKKILYEQIEKLLHMKAGDISRLEHIKESIEQNRRIYKSDYSYIQDLAKVQGLKTFESPDETFGFLKFCKKCNGELLTGAKFCSFCGTEQNRYSDFDEVLSRRKLLDQSRKILAKIRAYHILAVAGGFAVLIPVFVAISSIDRIEEIIIFYFDYDISEFENFFYGLGTISILWSLFVIVLPFVLKRPKQVGKFLFFSSFVLLLVSLLSGIMGFVLILIGGIIALKRRYPI